MTATETILTALAQRPDPTQPIDWPELVLLAWRADPVRFGMHRYRQYPDTKRIAAEAANMKRKGLLTLKRGNEHVSPTIQGVYRLTAAGLKRGRNQTKGAA